MARLAAHAREQMKHLTVIEQDGGLVSVEVHDAETGRLLALLTFSLHPGWDGALDEALRLAAMYGAPARIHGVDVPASPTPRGSRGTRNDRPARRSDRPGPIAGLQPLGGGIERLGHPTELLEPGPLAEVPDEFSKVGVRDAVGLLESAD